MKLLDIKATCLLLIAALFITIGCTTDQLVDTPEESTIEKESTPSALRQNSAVSPPTYSKNELIIRYAPHVTKEADKQQIRDEHGVIVFKKCNCDNNSIELWGFPADIIDILEKATNATNDDDVQRAELNYDVFVPDPISSNGPEPDPVALQNLIKQNNSGVTIAILDTGLDYTNSKFEKEFLYNHVTRDNCKEETLYSNWNYTHNPEADLIDQNGHGTEIAYMQYKALLNRGIDFQILPIKAFDKDGNSNSFNVTCGLMYAKDRGADIVSISFGYYDTNIEFIQDEILNAEKQILYVVASGNDAINIDEEISHYPSSIASGNVLSVTGVDAKLERLWQYSNYGPISVDVAAQSEDLNSIVGDNALNGTSYAVPQVAARAAMLFSESEGVQDLKSNIIESGTPLESLEGMILHPVIINNN